VQITNPSGNTTYIVQSGQWGEYLGHEGITFAVGNPYLKGIQSKQILLDSTVPANGTIEEEVKIYRFENHTLSSLFSPLLFYSLPEMVLNARLLLFAESQWTKSQRSMSDTLKWISPIHFAGNRFLILFQIQLQPYIVCPTILSVSMIDGDGDDATMQFRGKECAIGNMAADAYRWFASQQSPGL
jgi:hypothetical protein